ncbi:MAG: hypothetical protein HY820_28235 [Acidobacteria bacterium]|nr:hypothetical protein [Acidobacteriota bacterium]
MTLRIPSIPSFQQWIRPPRAVLTLFFLLMASCSAALYWLAWQFMVQEREVEQQRQLKQLESAASNIAALFQLVLTRGDVQIRITKSSITVIPAGGISYVPGEGAPEPDLDEKFAAAEALEYAPARAGDAAQAYLQLAASGRKAIVYSVWIQSRER